MSGPKPMKTFKLTLITTNSKLFHQPTKVNREPFLGQRNKFRVEQKYNLGSLEKVFSTCMSLWQRHQPTWKRWQRRPWRQERCLRCVLNLLCFQMTHRLWAIAYGPHKLWVLFELDWDHLLWGHVDFWSFEANFLCHFLYFRFIYLLKTFIFGFFLLQKIENSSVLTFAEWYQYR